jgi:hypothetical protein
LKSEVYEDKVISNQDTTVKHKIVKEMKISDEKGFKSILANSNFLIERKFHHANYNNLSNRIRIGPGLTDGAELWNNKIYYVIEKNSDRYDLYIEAYEGYREQVHEVCRISKTNNEDLKDFKLSKFRKTMKSFLRKKVNIEYFENENSIDDENISIISSNTIEHVSNALEILVKSTYDELRKLFYIR